MTSSPSAIKLPVIEATPSTFKDYGQIISPSPDGTDFGPQDAQLDLTKGIPRFYIMHLQDRPFEFSTITHHANVTQCLGAIGGGVWYLGVAKGSIVNPDEMEMESVIWEKKVVQSKCGHQYVAPVVEDVCVFRFSGAMFVKLDVGTWHAGPLFKEESMDFYNLELSDTNAKNFGSCCSFSD
ncbi:hypothetical protein ACHQM5_021797 [Ranunculus cassubicifolius]